MKSPIILISFLVVSMSGYSQADLLIDQHHKWLTLFNTEVDRIGTIYTEDALLFSPTGNRIEGQEEIQSYFTDLASQDIRVDSVGTIQKVQADPRHQYDYEIGTYTNSEGQSFVQLIIWRVNEEESLKELEVISTEHTSTADTSGINAARNLWMELCNKHDAAQLVKEVYTADALYYNHKPLVIGTESITKEYAYMNDPKYSLQLQPIIVKPVNDSTAYEIGQCSGAYGGKYVFVWKKVEGQGWKVYMDSNI